MRDDTAALVPVRQETVNFYGDEIAGAELADGTVYVPLRPICDALGLDWASQYQRIKRDPVLARAEGVVIITTPGGRQPATCLPLKLLPGWLFKIQVGRVRPDLREKIERYQFDCYEVLWNAFKGEILPTAPPTPGLTGTALAVEQARAHLRLAEQQHALEQRMDTMAGYMREFVKDTKHRLTALEVQVGQEAVVSDTQAAEIAQAVKHVALAWATKDGANHYGAIYDALYKHFGVSSYKSVPRSQFAAVMAWLKEWFDQVSREG